MKCVKKVESYALRAKDVNLKPIGTMDSRSSFHSWYMVSQKSPNAMHLKSACAGMPLPVASERTPMAAHSGYLPLDTQTSNSAEG